MKTLLLSVVAAASLPVVDAQAQAQSCTMHSPAYRVALVELYTSEGCSSCPPADAFLRGTSFRADQAVPLALHVDYWNYIGWRDPFSHKAYTERQHWLSGLAGSRAVYTPEFFVDGKELRRWESGLADMVARTNRSPALADIRIALGPLGASGVPVSVQASAKDSTGKGATLYVALVESGLSSQVKTGENQGRLLQHDHVVRTWLSPVKLGGEGARLEQTLVLPAGSRLGKLAVSAFVQSPQGEVLQAASLPLCGG